MKLHYNPWLQLTPVRIGQQPSRTRTSLWKNAYHLPLSNLVTTVYINVFKAGLVSLQYMFEKTVHILSLSDSSISSKMCFIVHLHTQNRKIFYFFPTFMHSWPVLCAWKPMQFYLNTGNFCLHCTRTPSHSDFNSHFCNIRKTYRKYSFQQWQLINR